MVPSGSTLLFQNKKIADLKYVFVLGTWNWIDASSKRETESIIFLFHTTKLT